MNSTTFTVFFEEPFWVGILEISDDDGVRAARHVFGEEPSGPELYTFGLSRDYDQLLRRALAGHPVPSPPPRAVNPKRAARAAAKERKARPASTAAQRAIQAALEQSKTDKRSRSRAQRLAAAARRAGAGPSQSQSAAPRALNAVPTTSRTSPRRFGTDSRRKRPGLVTDH